MERINIKKIGIVLLIIVAAILIFGSDSDDAIPDKNFFIAKVILIAIVLIGASFYYTYKWFVVDSILFKVDRDPLIKIGTINSGVPASFEGIIKTNKPLISPHSQTPCVFYHYILEKYIRAGKHSRWSVVENKSNNVPFQVSDDSGEITVNLRNIDSDLGHYKLNSVRDYKYPDYLHSEVDAEKILDKLNFEKEKKFLFFFNKEDQYRVSEYILKPQQKVFVYGWVYDESKQKVVSESKDTPLIVSRKSKDAFLADFAVGSKHFYSSNLLLFIAVTALYFAIRAVFSIPLYILGILLLAVIVKMIIQIYNRIITLRNRMDNALSQIDIEMKKRYELIPKLQLSIKEYTKYEKKIFSEIIRSRSALLQNQAIVNKYTQEEKRLDKELIGLMENYPRLKASKNFSQLITQLSKIENNIAYFRGFYNKTALKYNTLIIIFPINILAKIAGFKEEKYLKS